MTSISLVPSHDLGWGRETLCCGTRPQLEESREKESKSQSDFELFTGILTLLHGIFREKQFKIAKRLLIVSRV